VPASLVSLAGFLNRSNSPTAYSCTTRVRLAPPPPPPPSPPPPPPPPTHASHQLILDILAGLQRILCPDHGGCLPPPHLSLSRCWEVMSMMCWTSWHVLSASSVRIMAAGSPFPARPQPLCPVSSLLALKPFHCEKTRVPRLISGVCRQQWGRRTEELH